MLANLKPKRKQAGFIRTNSSKALPTFKITSPQRNNSSDFSSFENENRRQSSQGEFSPYKHPPANLISRPPLPTKTKNIQQMFSNEKLKRNYQSSTYANPSQPPTYPIPQSTKNKYNQSPNKGKILNTNELDMQTKQILRRRAQVERQLAEINKICNQIGKLQSPKQSASKQKYQRANNKQKQKQLQKYTEIRNKSKSKEKPKIQYKFEQQNDQIQQQQISFESRNNKKVSATETLAKYDNFMKNNSKSKQAENKHRIQDKQILTLNPDSKTTENYELEESGISSNSQIQQSSFQYQNTFKPNPSQSPSFNNKIINKSKQYKNEPTPLQSVQQYKKLHGQNKLVNSRQNRQKQMGSKSQQKLQTKQYQNNIKYEHEKARQRFISQRQQSSGESSQQQQQQQQYQHQLQVQEQQQQVQQLIEQYPKQQFKAKTIKQCVEQIRQNNPHCINNYSNINNQNKNKKNKQVQIQTKAGLYKTKGGVCFDLDVHQFTQVNDKKNQKPTTKPVTRRNKKTNTKQEILKRRQMAKNYDRIARAKVFGNY